VLELATGDDRYVRIRTAGVAVTRTSSEAIAKLDSALHAWAATAGDVARKANASAKQLVAVAESEVTARAKRVATIEAALASARGEARARLTRELQAATVSLEHGRRGLNLAKDAERRAQVLQRRVAEATDTRVSRASKSLQHKIRALADYKAVPTPSSNASHAGASRAHQYLQLGKMIGLAVASQTADALGQTADQATTRMPDRVGEPLSAAGALFHEIHGNWDVYRLTPEFLAMHVNDPHRGK
jgi:hypothetical protein